MPINPETLKKLRGDLSQDGLADKAGLTRRTISRIETGKADPAKIHRVTVERLAKALGTTPEKLADAPTAQTITDAMLRHMGLRKLSTYLDGDTALSFTFVEERYGIPPKRQIDMAPLFTAILAELCLRERTEKLEINSSAFENYYDTLPKHLQQGQEARTYFKYAYDDEKASIESKDLFGKSIQEAAEVNDYVVWPFDPDESNPFASFITSLANNLKIDIEDNTGIAVPIGMDGLPEQTCVFHSELEKICGASLWAELALQQGYARIRDIPDDLRADDKVEERAAWLEARYPAELRAKREREMESIVNSFSDDEVENAY